MALEDRGAQHDKVVVDKFVDPIADYTMTVRDYVVRPSADDATGPFTVTLPPVAEAKGRFYSIFIEDADGTNTVTLDDNNNDSERWFLTGTPFSERGQGVVVYSDGRRWNVSAQGVIGSQFSSARVDGVAVIHAGIIQLIMENASSVNMAEALRVTLTADVKTGVWANAICGVINYQTDGLAHGAAGVVCAEIDMPGSAVVRGTYWLFQAEINCPTGCAMGGNPMAVMAINSWGANKTQFDDVGLFLDISGVTSGSGDFWYESDITLTKVDALIKIRVNGTFYYIPVSNVVTGGD